MIEVKDEKRRFFPENSVFIVSRILYLVSDFEEGIIEFFHYPFLRS